MKRRNNEQIISSNRMTHKHRITHGIFVGASFLLSLFAWYQVRNGFNVTAFLDLILITALTVCSLALFILALYIFSPVEVFIVFAAYCAAFLMALPFHIQYLLAVTLAFLIFWRGVSAARKNIRGRLAISFHSLLLYGVPSLLTALALLFAFAGYFYSFNFANAHIGPGVFSYAIPFIENLASSQFPYYRHGMTLDEFLLAGANDSATAQFGSIPKQAQGLIDAEVIKQRDAFGKQAGVAITGKETISDMFVLIANEYLNRYLFLYKNFVPLLVALSVFLSIKSIGFIINRFAVGTAWLIAHLLMAFGVIAKQKVTAEREILAINFTNPNFQAPNLHP